MGRRWECTLLSLVVVHLMGACRGKANGWHCPSPTQQHSAMHVAASQPAASCALQVYGIVACIRVWHGHDPGANCLSVEGKGPNRHLA